MPTPNKLKRPPTHGTLQNAIVAAINDPNYSFSLPRLSDWESIVSSSADEKERLEFVGDAIMHLSVALYLYRLFPDAAPGFYTNIRSAVNANATFTHLMAKAGAYELPSQPYSTKAAADSFEVIVAALYMERGFPDVYAWVQEQYAPLIIAARESYDKCMTSDPLLPAKRRGDPLDPASTLLFKKVRLSSRRSSSRSTLMARRIIKRMKSKGKVRLCLLPKKPNAPVEKRLRSYELGIPERSHRPSSLVIDLTVDGDSDGEELTPSNVTEAFQPKVTSSKARLPSSRFRPTTEANQTCDCVDSLCSSSKLGSTVLPSYSHKPPGSPPLGAPCTAATSPNPITSAIPLDRPPSPSLLPPVRTPTPPGSRGNPIIIEEDSENES